MEPAFYVQCPDNEVYTNAPLSYVIRALPLMVIFNFSGILQIQKHWLMKVHKKDISPEGMVVGRHAVNTKR
jgi:hypothetical protein